MVIKDISSDFYQPLGDLMVEVYSKLDGFPTPDEQPDYFKMLSNIGSLSKNEHTQVLIAIDQKKQLLGGVVYFSDMSAYGSGGTATSVKNASGIRLLGVDPRAREKGVGRKLTEYCIKLARTHGSEKVVLHTTASMRVAWHLYQGLGFNRAENLDFKQKDLDVYGFTLNL